MWFKDEEEPWFKECEWSLASGKGKEKDPLLVIQERKATQAHSDFSPVRPIFDFSPPRE